MLPTLNGTARAAGSGPSLRRAASGKRRRALAYALIALFIRDPVPADERQAAHPARPAAPRVHAVRHHVPAHRHAAASCCCWSASSSRSSCSPRCFGRVWCGWACPQTVYMEFLFRPIERWLEGGRARLAGARRGPPARSRGGCSSTRSTCVLGAVPGPHLPRLLRRRRARWSSGCTRSPVEHPTAFLVMAGTTALIFFDFAWFREQTCLVACPYGRLQSVLLDRSSLIVGYDARRGEPRAHRAQGPRRPAPATASTAARASLTCPTGIDIRDGLQMECIHCTQCIDACDAVMDQDRAAARPDPLQLARRARRASRGACCGRASCSTRCCSPWRSGAARLRARAPRADADVTLLRGIGAPFTRRGRRQRRRTRSGSRSSNRDAADRRTGTAIDAGRRAGDARARSRRAIRCRCRRAVARPTTVFVVAAARARSTTARARRARSGSTTAPASST